MLGARWQLAPLVGVVVVGTGGLGGQGTKPEQPASLPAGAVRQLGEVRFPNVGRTLSVAFSPDGKTLAAGSWDDTVRLWDVATGKELRQLTGHKAYVNSVRFSRDGKLLWTHGGDRTCRVWESGTGKPLQVLQCPAGVGG